MSDGDVQREGAPLVRLSLEVLIRPCRRADLEPLEWFGAFRSHRAFVAAQFERHLRGDNVMLVAEHKRFPVGQVWIDLARKPAERAAVVWALRVFEPFQGLGIGTHLLAAAERRAAAAGRAVSEIGVEKHLASVRRLYERLGYRVAGEERSEETYMEPDGSAVRYTFDQWILRKRIEGAS